MLADTTRAMAGAVDGRLAALRATGGLPGPGGQLWATPFGGYRDQAGTAFTTGFEYGFGGLVGGYDRAVSDTTLLGLFGGFTAGETSSDRAVARIDAIGAFGGGYLSHGFGRAFVDLSVAAGVMMHDSERTIANNLVAGGLETATADYDGLFVTPALTFGLDTTVGATVLTPSLRLRYAGLALDGYHETGSVAALAIDERQVHVVELRGQLQAALAGGELDGGAWNLRVRAGVDGIFHWGDEVDAVLLGQGLSFDAGEDDAVARGFLGAEAAFLTVGGALLTAGVEFGYDTAEAFTADGRLGVNLRF